MENVDNVQQIQDEAGQPGNDEAAKIQDQGTQPKDETMQFLDKPKAEWGKHDHIKNRIYEKARREADEQVKTRVTAELEKIRRMEMGEIPDDQEMLRNYAQNTTEELQQYRLADFIKDNPQFEADRNAIAEAMTDKRYVGLGIPEVASIVAGPRLFAKKDQSDTIDRNDPASQGADRGYQPNPVQNSSNLTDAQRQEILQKSRMGQEFSSGR